ncbi:MAG: hypothetical protein R2855_02660 [Thermomicrobiales bacterium]
MEPTSIVTQESVAQSPVEIEVATAGPDEETSESEAAEAMATADEESSDDEDAEDDEDRDRYVDRDQVDRFEVARSRRLPAIRSTVRSRVMWSKAWA